MTEHGSLGTSATLQGEILWDMRCVAPRDRETERQRDTETKRERERRRETGRERYTHVVRSYFGARTQRDTHRERDREMIVASRSSASGIWTETEKQSGSPAQPMATGLSTGRSYPAQHAVLPISPLSLRLLPLHIIVKRHTVHTKQVILKQF